MAGGGQAEALKDRTKRFAIRIVRYFQALPKAEEARVMGRQVLRSGTSVGSNYRAVCRARSKAEPIAKMGIVVEEADETVFWLELLEECGIGKQSPKDGLLQEANELLAIFAASLTTAKSNRRLDDLSRH